MRALTRVATASSEEGLLELAGALTASQLERALRVYRRITAADARETHELEFVSYHFEEDGSLYLRARLAAEDGTLLVKALDAAHDRVLERRREERAVDVGGDETDTRSHGVHHCPAGTVVGVTDLLSILDLAQLRTRTSVKWRAYEPDVLPLWVAEMDVPLAEPVVRAVSDLVAAGDTGYPASPDEYIAAFSAFAADRWGWQVDATLARVVPDVLAGKLRLAPALNELLSNPDLAQIKGQAGLAAVEAKRGSAARNIEIIRKYRKKEPAA